MVEERQANPSHPSPGDAPAVEADTDLLRILAHELLNSLTVIGGYATTLRMTAKTGSAEFAAQCAGVIERHAAQMEALIRSSQDARAMELGTLDLRPATVDLAPAVEEVVAELKLDDHPVELHLAAGVKVVADPARLRQGIAALVGNAAKFSPPGAAIRVSVAADAGAGVVTVGDEGPGIPPGGRDQVFAKFGRLDHKVPGSGLGLYVARGVARAQGGDVRVVDSERGATVELRLPLAGE